MQLSVHHEQEPEGGDAAHGDETHEGAMESSLRFSPGTPTRLSHVARTTKYMSPIRSSALNTPPPKPSVQA